MTFEIEGTKVEGLKFKHLDYYDALAHYVNQKDATENDPPWAYLRTGSYLTLCSAVIDGRRFEGWAHKVPQDRYIKSKGNAISMLRMFRAAGMNHEWRKKFWRIYRGV